MAFQVSEDVFLSANRLGFSVERKVEMPPCKMKWVLAFKYVFNYCFGN